MGYEIVRLDGNGEPKRVHSVEDQNYFRLNVDVMGRARTLALWGAGVLLNTDMLNYTMVSAALRHKQPSLEEVYAVHELADEAMTEWIEPFVDNDKKAVSYKHCCDFANNLQKALAEIRDSPVKQDYETKILWAFVDFLQGSTQGVWVE